MQMGTVGPEVGGTRLGAACSAVETLSAGGGGGSVIT